MSGYDPSKSVLLNLRVIDHDAASELSNHLQTLLDRSGSSVATLTQLLEQAQRVLDAAPAMAQKLDEQLRGGTSLQDTLRGSLMQAQGFIGDLDARRHSIDSACTRFSGEVAQSAQRLENLGRESEQRVRSLTEDSSERVQKEFMPAFERAQAMAELIKSAEAAVAVSAMRTALSGGAAPVAVPAAVDPSAAAAELERKESAEVQELRAQLNELNIHCTELERKHHVASESQTALLSGVSQELRREIELLLTSAEALRSTMLDQKQVDHLNEAAASASALLEMVLGIPDLTSEPPPLPTGSESEFDLRLETQSMSGLLTKRARDKGQTLTCQVEADVPTAVCGDSGRLRQSLLYMINGAFKLAGPGEVLLHAYVEHSIETHTCVRVSISHVGKGITSEQLNCLFHTIPPVEPSQVPDDKTQNTSLGLAVAKQLVHRLGGCVGVEADQPDRFTLWFNVQWRKPLASAENRRFFNRLLLESVRSNIGPVVDLSLGGARIRCVKEHEGEVQLELTDDETTVKVAAEVTWSTRLGWRKHEIGVRFMNVTPDVAEQLTRLTMQNRVRRVMGAQS